MGRLEAFRKSYGTSAGDSSLLERYFAVRKYSEFICEPLLLEDYVVQPSEEVSPPKWHLAHTTWFFETFVLSNLLEDYNHFHPRYAWLFNSYYEGAGEHSAKPDRGNLSRPSVDEILEYRAYVDQHMIKLIGDGNAAAESIIELGLHHEQQHQELLYTDIKYILGQNPLFPTYHVEFRETPHLEENHSFIRIEAGVYDIGAEKSGFSFDHERPQHKVMLPAFEIRASLITNDEYIAFINAGGYRDYRYWLSEGWEWVKRENISAPLYWREVRGHWFRYALSGLEEVNPDEPVTHVSFFEAHAFATWAGKRLPTEFEWEAAAPHLPWGLRWEHTNSAFLPYPGYRREAGLLGEYNGKFMVNSMVLRGASVVTPANHSRVTYRNFYAPHYRWQFTGIRLCKD